MKQKISEIILEIAAQGLKNPNNIEFEPFQPLMFVAYVAWNRDTKSSSYFADIFEVEVDKFPISEQCKKTKLISDDWNDILETMLSYKKRHFPEDRRVITSCGTTPQGTLRVEYE